MSSPAPVQPAGRVAAGAIAEQYLTAAHGIQIVAFVTGVGNIHLPSFSATDDEPLSPEFMSLLKTITREEVDKELTRCPNPEISAKMAEVSCLTFLRPTRSESASPLVDLRLTAPRASLLTENSESELPRPTWTRSEEPSPV